MATLTTRLGATKPASTENVSVTVLNNNFDLFDTAVASSVGTSASRPASAFQGRFYYTTDSTTLYVNTAANASTVASWADPVANRLLSNVTLGGSLSASGGGVDITRSASASNAYTANVSADTQKRLAVTAGGVVNWGSGASAADTNLYRFTANTLKTDDSLIVDGTLNTTGTVTASAGVNVGGDLAVTGGVTVVGKGAKTLITKSVLEGLASSTTLQDDNDFTFTLAASAIYELRAHLQVAGAAAGDFKAAWAFTGAASGAGGTRVCIGPPTTTTDSTDGNVRCTRHGWTTSVSYGLDGTNPSAIEETGILNLSAVGSGGIRLQWAQNSSSATSTTISGNSWVTLERLT